MLISISRIVLMIMVSKVPKGQVTFPVSEISSGIHTFVIPFILLGFGSLSGILDEGRLLYTVSVSVLTSSSQFFRYRILGVKQTKLFSQFKEFEK